jgi:hypothetical protein
MGKELSHTGSGFKINLNWAGRGNSKKPLIRAVVKDGKFNLKKTELVTIFEENYKDILILVTGRNFLSVNEQDIIFTVLRRIFAELKVQDGKHPLLNPSLTPYSGDTLTWQGSVYDLLKTKTTTEKYDSQKEYRKVLNSLKILGHTEFHYEVKGKTGENEGFIISSAINVVKKPNSNKVQIGINKYFLQMFLQYSKLINPDRYDKLKGKYAKLLYCYLPFYPDFKQVEYTIEFDELKAYLDPDDEYSNDRTLASRMRDAFQEIQDEGVLESVEFDKAGKYLFNTVTFKYSMEYRAEMAQWVKKQKELMRQIEKNMQKPIELISTGKEDDAEFERMKKEFYKARNWVTEQDRKLVENLKG